MIAKVFVDDPLICPKCKGQMKIVAFIEEDGLITRILKHLGLWEPEERPAANSPPVLEIRTLIKSEPFTRMRRRKHLGLIKARVFFYCLAFSGLRPQDAGSEDWLAFHLFGKPLVLSPSRAANAAGFWSTAASRQAMAASSCPWPDSSDICTMFIPSSSQCDARACLSWCAWRPRGTSEQKALAVAACALSLFLAAVWLSLVYGPPLRE